MHASRLEEGSENGPQDIHIVNTHATLRRWEIFRNVRRLPKFSRIVQIPMLIIPKGLSAMPWGLQALELAGNLPSFEDMMVHPSINVDELDPKCSIPNLVLNQPTQAKRVDAILNNSFGMLGINSAIVSALQTSNGHIFMSKDECKQVVLDIIAEIAPDEELSDVKPDVALREQLDLDSMDFLDIVMELRKKHGIEVPESEYGQLVSLDSCFEYLTPKFNALV